MSKVDNSVSLGFLWDSNTRIIAVGISAANLSLIPLWRSLLYADGMDLYFLPSTERHDYFAAVLTLILVSAVIISLLKAIVSLQRLRSWLLFVLLGGIALNVLNFLRLTVVTFGVPSSTAKILFLGVLLVIGLAFVRFQYHVLSIIFSFFLIMSPFAAITGVSVLLKNPLEAPDLSGEENRPKRVSDTRVVWVVFDELDGRFLFGAHRGNSSYDSFDTLRQHSVYLSNAVPVSAETITALPSYWTGERVERAIRQDHRSIDLQIAGDATPRPLDDFNHVFRAAWQQGARIGATGFYHPYCRLFSEYLSECTDFFYVTVLHRRSNNIFDSIRMNVASLTPLWARIAKIRVVNESRERMLEQVGDLSLDFVALHMSMPHSPPIYDPELGRMRLSRFGLNYQGNLQKADLLLKEIINRMQDSGVWDRTHLIVTSDHGLRELDGAGSEPGAIPLFIRMAGQNRPLAINNEIDAAIMRSLILGLLADEFSTPAELAFKLRGNLLNGLGE